MARKLIAEYPGAIYPVMNHGGDERAETEVAKAGRVSNEELERRGSNAAELEHRRKGDSQNFCLTRV